MGAHFMPPFSRMIEKMPVEAIVAMVKREAQMLADDLAQGRTVPNQETRSLLSFHRFLEAILTGVEIPPVVLSMTDTAFYRRTTERLVQAGKLPDSARERFEIVFSRPALRLLSSSA